MTSTAIRRAARAAAAIPAAATLFCAPAAFATDTGGDNGTVKIHDAATGEAVRANQPHVCTFYLDAFGFDGGQKVTWDIREWAPTGTKGKDALSGDLVLGDDGHERTKDLSLPDGHYKLYWNFDGEHGRAKQKVFWVDCGKESSTPPGHSASPSPSPSESTPSTVSPTESTPSTVSPTESAPGSQPTASPTAAGGKGGSLAETGSNGPLFGTLGAVALAMVAAGAWLLRRRGARG